MNAALFSPRFLLPALLAWVVHFAGFAALRTLADVPVTLASVAAFALAFSVLGCFLHEKITRCWSPLWERALRFGTFFFVIAIAPVASLGVMPGDASPWLLLGAGWAISVVGFAWPIHLLYHFNPKGDSKYFSVSSKFQTDPRARVES